MLLNIGVEFMNEAGEVVCAGGFSVDGIRSGDARIGRIECYGVKPEEIHGWRPKLVLMTVKTERGAPIKMAQAMKAYRLERGAEDLLAWYEPLVEE